MPQSLLICNMLLFFCIIGVVDAVTCHTCKDFISGCAGGAACPFLTKTVENVAGLAAGTAGAIVLRQLIPPHLMSVFPRPTIERLCHLVQQIGRSGVFDPNGRTFTEIYSAFINGKIGKPDATSALLTILADVNLSEAMRASVAATLSALAAAPAVSIVGTNEAGELVGPMRFIVASILKYLMAKVNVIALGGTSNASSSKSLNEITLTPPRTEETFYEMLTLFILFCHALGAADVLLTTVFIDQVVHEKQRRFNYSWMMAYCLFITYLKAVDDSTTGATLANIHSDGGLDSHTDEAVALGTDSYGITFRKQRQAGVARVREVDSEGKDVGKVKVWNKKDSPRANKACISHNRGTAHPQQSLKPDGTCKYKHVCFHWISGAGKDAICGSKDHVVDDCDHADKCDSAASA